MIYSGLDRHESRILKIADQSHGLARSAQSCLNLGTNGNPFHIAAQHLRQKIVPLMSSVKTNLFTEEATADAKPERALLLSHAIGMAPVHTDDYRAGLPCDPI